MGFPEGTPDMLLLYPLVIIMVGMACLRPKDTPLRGNSPHLEDRTPGVNIRINI